MSKKELVRKHREEQEATAFAFQEFINTFQDSSGPPNKLFVKSTTLNAKPGNEDADKGKIYNPPPLTKPSSNTLRNAIECATLLKENKVEKTKGQKPKSNLELLKEELRLRHIERDVRNKYKGDLLMPQGGSSNDCTDQTTTNIFVANINPKFMEQDLIEIFGSYGPLASVKIMWPRNEDKNRNTSNCGFVAYMSRKDGERALRALKARDDMRVGWGKPVEIPPHPIYIPPELLKLQLPPPFTGLPFNAQPLKQPFKQPTTPEEMQQLLYNSVVQVTIPMDKKTLMLIHRTIEFVINEGPLFEAMIMNKEINNPAFHFLFDNKNPTHIYYRWKMYSILQGESPTNWSTKRFRMFKGGSIWIPPVIMNYTDGMPEVLVDKEERQRLLSDAQKNRLIQYIQQLTPNRVKVGEVMVFCINHREASKCIVDIIVNAFDNPATKPPKKIARLYLVSDILYNCSIKMYTTFKDDFQESLPDIFEKLQRCHNNILNNQDKDIFKNKILKVLRAWDLWKIYSNDFLTKLELLVDTNGEAEALGDDSGTDEPLDGKKLIERSLMNSGETKTNCVIIKDDEQRTQPQPLSGFIPSKWETIDPVQVEAQAMSTKKFYDMELAREKEKHKTNLNVKERDKLRQIEVMVMQYQDELEMGERKIKPGKSLDSQVNDYRKRLVENMKRDAVKRRHESPVSSDSSDDYRKENSGKSSSKRYTRNKYRRN